MESFQNLIEDYYKYNSALIKAEFELRGLIEKILMNTPIVLLTVRIECNTRQPRCSPIWNYPRAIVSYTIGNDGCGYDDLEKLFDNLSNMPQLETALDMEKVVKTIRFGNSPKDPAVRTLQFDIIPLIEENTFRRTDEFSQGEQEDQSVKVSPDDEDLLEEESMESQAAYESLKAVQKQMDAVQPTYIEDCQSDDFALIMAQPINTRNRILKTIATLNKESDNTDNSEPVIIENDTLEKNEEILQEEENLWKNFLNKIKYYTDLSGTKLYIRITQDCGTEIPIEEATPVVMGNLSYSERVQAEQQLAFKYLRFLLCDKIEELISLYNEYKENNDKLLTKQQKEQEKTLQPESDIVELYNSWGDERVDVDESIVIKEDDNEENNRLQDVRVYQTRWNNECYFVRANIMGIDYYAELTNEHVEKYLERDENGLFTRKITPMMLAKTYFKKVLNEYETIEQGDVIKIGSKVQWDKGFEAIFEKTDMESLHVSEEQRSLVKESDPRIIQYIGKRYIDATVNGIHKTEKLDENDKAIYELRPTDEGYINPIDMFLIYFVHELPFLQKGIEMERESDLIHCAAISHKENSNIMLTEENKTDYSLITLPEGYKLENPTIYKTSNNKYSIDATLKGGIYKKATNLWMRREGKHISSYLTENEIANLLERDENGKFTRRVSAKDIATERALPIIEEMEDVYNMHCAGIPAKIIEEVMCWTEGELKSFLKDFSFQRNKYISTAFLRKKDKDKIRDDYEDGCSLSTLRKKYKFKDYSILYAVLKDKINSQNPVLPDDIGIGQITMESSKSLEQDD